MVVRHIHGAVWHHAQTREIKPGRKYLWWRMACLSAQMYRVSMWAMLRVLPSFWELRVLQERKVCSVILALLRMCVPHAKVRLTSESTTIQIYLRPCFELWAPHSVRAGPSPRMLVFDFTTVTSTRVESRAANRINKIIWKGFHIKVILFHQIFLTYYNTIRAGVWWSGGKKTP